jgi:hypothetical protein
MRTTLDLPDDLLRQAKIVAVERGCTLRALFTRALEQELKRPASPPVERPELPFLEVRDDCPALQLHPEVLESIDADDEAENALEVYRRR